MGEVPSKGVAACFAEQNWEKVNTDSLIHKALVNLKSTGLGMATHFNDDSALMFHLLRDIKDIPVIHVCEPERPAFMDELVRTYRPNLHLFEMRGSETKRQTLVRAFAELSLDGVFFGIHRYQNDNRATKKLVEYDDSGPRPFCRIHPVLDWGPKWVNAYFNLHALPHPREHVPGTRIQEKECGIHCTNPEQVLAP